MEHVRIPETIEPTAFDPEFNHPFSHPIRPDDEEPSNPSEKEAWHNSWHNYFLAALWLPEEVEFEPGQFLDCVPSSLLEYRQIVWRQFVILDEFVNVPHQPGRDHVDPGLYIRSIEQLQEELKGLNHLVKEHFRCFWTEGEPPRTREERDVGFRFGDLVHGVEGSPLHNWPSYVVAVNHRESSVWIRQGIYKPGECDSLGSLPGAFYQTAEDTLKRQLVKYSVEDIVRLPPILKEAAATYNRRLDPNATTQVNFRTHFPGIPKDEVEQPNPE